jgi:gliding motility-associated-like protein
MTGDQNVIANFIESQEVVTVPIIPSGTSDAKVGQAIQFITGGSTSNLGYELEYRFDWGDGYISAWRDSVQSHTYLTVGTFNVKSRARSQNDSTVVSNWSSSFSVTISGHLLNITINGSGSVTKEPDKAEYNHHEKVNLTAIPSEGYIFNNWDIDITGNSNPDSILMTKDQSVIANFIEYTDIPTTPSIPVGTSEAEVGESLIYTTGGSTSALGNDLEYRFDWGDGIISVWGDSIRSHIYYTVGNFIIKAQARSLTDTTVTSNWSLGKIITLAGHQLEIAVSGSGTVIKEPDKSEYNHYDKVILTAVPTGESQFDKWEGNLSSRSNPDSVIMESDMAVIAYFSGVSEGVSALPNPFTPNNDGFNDYVTFKYPEMDTKKPVVRIYNLRGRKVNELNKFFGGNYHWYGQDDDGNELEPGVYLYIVEVENIKISSGTITLIK